MNVGITLTSSLEIGDEYISLTRKVAKALAERGDGIVFGGTNYGMMATLADSYKKFGGDNLIGVMAKDLMSATKGYVAHKHLDSSYLENTMEDRKRRIIEQSDVFLILPGGYGTLEEIGSIVGGKVNKLFDKPIAVYNYGNFYDSFIKFLVEMQNKRFSKVPIEDLIFISDDFNKILEYFESYKPKDLVDKFV